MMYTQFARFEIRYQLLSVPTLAGAVLVFALAFTLGSVPELSRGISGANSINSAYVVTTIIHTLTTISLVVPMAFLANVVLRDRENAVRDLYFALPVSRRAYFGGRFVGASIASLVILALIPLGMGMGVHMPWLDPEAVGPFRPIVYLYAFAVFAIPNLFVPGAIVFTVANVSGSRIAVGVVLAALIALSGIGVSLAATASTTGRWAPWSILSDSWPMKT